jgi:hypothetical protein
MSDTTQLNSIQNEDDNIEIENYNNEDPTKLIEELTSNDFNTYMTESKKKLYTLIVFGPEDEESDAAQDNTLLERYIKELDILGKSIIKMINNPTGLVLEEELKNYSSDTRSHVQDTLNYTRTFIKNNSINKLQYINYIYNIFSVYPFLQLGYFPK